MELCGCCSGVAVQQPLPFSLGPTRFLNAGQKLPPVFLSVLCVSWQMPLCTRSGADTVAVGHGGSPSCPPRRPALLRAAPARTWAFLAGPPSPPPRRAPQLLELGLQPSVSTSLSKPSRSSRPTRTRTDRDRGPGRERGSPRAAQRASSGAGAGAEASRCSGLPPCTCVCSLAPSRWPCDTGFRVLPGQSGGHSTRPAPGPPPSPPAPRPPGRPLPGVPRPGARSPSAPH